MLKLVCWFIFFVFCLTLGCYLLQKTGLLEKAEKLKENNIRKEEKNKENERKE